MMIAREINSRFENGALKLVDDWDGIKTGFKPIISDVSEITKPTSSCWC